MHKFVLGFALLAVAGCSFSQGAGASAPVERGAPLARMGGLGAQLAPDPTGVRIVSVLPGLMAEKFEMKPGDIITRFNGVEVRQPADIQRQLRSLRAGQALAVTYLRDGQTRNAEGSMVPRPLVTEDGMTVIYDQVKVGDRRIRVIITHPKGKGPFPAVFLIGGIGGYSVDAPFATMPYGTIMGPVARAGYATIRVEKPGQGDSEGPVYTELLFEDELAAYVQGMRLARTNPAIDKDRIAVFGHSMGGTFGPMLAGQVPIAGLAVNGTLARTWVEYEVENTRRQLMLGGTPAQAADAFMRPVTAIQQLLFNEQWSVADLKAKRPDLVETFNQICPDGKTMSGVGIPFFQQLAKRNLGEAWAAVKVPTLVTYGENDFISGEWDHLMIRDIVNTGKAGRAEYVKLANSDHGFWTTSSFRDSMEKWGKPGGVFNNNIVTTLLPWLDRVLKERVPQGR